MQFDIRSGNKYSNSDKIYDLHSKNLLLTFLLQTNLLIEIPTYRNQNIASPVSVSFYVCNGKRRRSQCQHFKYLPPKGKQEHHTHRESLASL